MSPTAVLDGQIETAAASAPAAGRWTAEIGSIPVTFGPGVLHEVGAVAGELAAGRVLVVTDPGLRAAGYPALAAQKLIRAGFDVRIFDGVSENPTTREVEAGARAAADLGADLLVAVGGGSVLDAAKGINFLATNGGRMEDYWGFGRARSSMLPSIGVPTTAGTGSDAQSYALITQAEAAPGMAHGRKMACGDRKARFSAVLLDPDLLATAPPGVLVAAGIDALSHAVESLVTTQRTPVSSLYAREAWRLLDGALETVLAPDGPARADLLLGAHLAGAAIEAAMLGAAHATANPLTAAYGIVHGVAVGLMLPHVVRWNAAVAEPLYRELVPAGAEALAARVEALRRLAGLPERLSDCGVESSRLPDLAERAAQEWTATFNPRPVSTGDLLRLYEAAY